MKQPCYQPTILESPSTLKCKIPSALLKHCVPLRVFGFKGEQMVIFEKCFETSAVDPIDDEEAEFSGISISDL